MTPECGAAWNGCYDGGFLPMELCRICETRKPKRACPGVGGDICALCCGAEREMTVDCPLDCEYLMEARRHEAPPEVNPDAFPNSDIRINDEFIRDNQPLMLFAARALLESAENSSRATDNDVREAVDAMIRTYRTASSGLIYETRPSNPYAVGVQHLWTSGLEAFRQRMRESLGITTIRDSDVLRALVFLQRLLIQHNNGRRRGRAFLSFLREHFPQPAESLIEKP
jgi:hypothetical protein